MSEQALLVLHVGHHLAHKVALINPGKAHADAVSALIQTKRHRDCHCALQLAVGAGFPQIFEQHIAAERITHRIQRGHGALGAQVAHGFRQIFTGAGVVTPGQQIGLT